MRLLEHDLRYPDIVRVFRVSPGQVAFRFIVPGEKFASNTLMDFGHDGLIVLLFDPATTRGGSLLQFYFTINIS